MAPPWKTPPFVDLERTKCSSHGRGSVSLGPGTTRLRPFTNSETDKTWHRSNTLPPPWGRAYIPTIPKVNPSPFANSFIRLSEPRHTTLDPPDMANTTSQHL